MKNSETNPTTEENQVNEQATALNITGKTLTVEVSVDAVAAKFAAQIDSPHANLLTNTIFGRIFENDKGAFQDVYNALNGYDIIIDLEEGQTVAFKDDWGTPAVGTILEIRKYKKGDNIKVSHNRNGSIRECWKQVGEISGASQEALNAYNVENPIFDVKKGDQVVVLSKKVEKTIISEGNYDVNQDYFYCTNSTRYSKNQIISVTKAADLVNPNPEA